MRFCVFLCTLWVDSFEENGASVLWNVPQVVHVWWLLMIRFRWPLVTEVWNELPCLCVYNSAQVTHSCQNLCESFGWLRVHPLNFLGQEVRVWIFFFLKTWKLKPSYLSCLFERKDSKHIVNKMESESCLGPNPSSLTYSLRGYGQWNLPMTWFLYPYNGNSNN